MKWSCVVCSHHLRSGVRPELCALCGAMRSFIPYEAPSTYERAVDVKAEQLKRYSTGDGAIDTLTGGGFPAGARVLIWGRGGSGKSRCALRWATHIGQALAVSLEMDNELCVRTAREAGACVEKLLITRDEKAELPGKRVRCIVWDSISQAVEPEQACERLSEWAARTQGIVLLVCHATKGGDYRGPSTLQHWGEAELQVRKSKRGFARVIVNKSRFCPTGSAVVSLVASP